MAKRLFTSESVTEGHPDKICDQISDAVLDAILAQDPDARVACETTASTGLIHVMGEITTSCYVDIPKIARQVVKEIGYDRAKFGFDCDTCAVVTSIDEQSPCPLQAELLAREIVREFQPVFFRGLCGERTGVMPQDDGRHPEAHFEKSAAGLQQGR